MRRRTKKSQRQIARSGSGVCPICDEQRLLVEHHIHGREVRDWDKPWNRCYICANCHDDVHAGEVLIEGWFSTTNGQQLIHRKKGEPEICGPAAQPNLYGEKNGKT